MKRVLQKYIYYLLSLFELLIYFKPILFVIRIFLHRIKLDRYQVTL